VLCFHLDEVASGMCGLHTMAMMLSVVIRLEMSPHASAVLFVSLVAET
jgi:hypothetical protein